MPKQLIFDLRLLNAQLQVQQSERMRVTLNSGPLCAEVEWPKIQKKLQERQEKRGWCNCKVQYLPEDRLVDLDDSECLGHLLELHQEALHRDTVELQLLVVPDPTDVTSPQAIDGEDMVFESDQQGGPFKLNLQSDILLGKGGFGQVRRTRDKHAAYAMKIAFPDERSRRSMKTEIHTLLQLNHPNIIRVLKHGSVLDLVNGRLPAYMMDLCRCSVQALLDTGWHSQAAAVALRQDVESALRHFHAAGLGHADVKPGNILVSNKIIAPNGEIQLELKLIDAGGAGRLQFDFVASCTPEYAHPLQRGSYALVYAFHDWYGFRKTILVAERLDSEPKRPGLTLSKIVQEASEHMENNREFILEAVRERGDALEYACKELRSDKEVVMEAVRECGDALIFACEEPRSDREVVMEAVRQSGFVLKFACEELGSDREVVMEAVRQCGYALEYACEELRSDKEVVMEAIRQCDASLKFACEELRSDREVVMEAVRQCDAALEYACEELRRRLSWNQSTSVAMRWNMPTRNCGVTRRLSRKKSANAAMRWNLHARNCGVTRRLSWKQSDRVAMRWNLHARNCGGGCHGSSPRGDALEYAYEELRSDKEVVTEEVRNRGDALEFACEELRSDKEFMEAVHERGDALEFACEELRSDKEGVMEALRQCGRAVRFACEELRSDKEFMEAVLRNCGVTMWNF